MQERMCVQEKISEEGILSLCSHYSDKNEANTGRTYLIHKICWLGADRSDNGIALRLTNGDSPHPPHPPQFSKGMNTHRIESTHEW